MKHVKHMSSMLSQKERVPQWRHRVNSVSPEGVCRACTNHSGQLASTQSLLGLRSSAVSNNPTMRSKATSFVELRSIRHVHAVRTRWTLQTPGAVLGPGCKGCISTCGEPPRQRQEDKAGIGMASPAGPPCLAAPGLPLGYPFSVLTCPPLSARVRSRRAAPRGLTPWGERGSSWLGHCCGGCRENVGNTTLFDLQTLALPLGYAAILKQDGYLYYSASSLATPLATLRPSMRSASRITRSSVMRA